jgi:hypothetical protein
MSLIGAGILAAGAIGGAVISSDASKSAANAQTTAANNATQVQQNEFNTVNSEQAPARNLGYGADSILAQLYGIANPSAAGTSALYPAANVGGTTGSPSSLPNAPNAGGIIGSGGANGGATGPSPGASGPSLGGSGVPIVSSAGYNPSAVYSPGGSINPSGAGTSNALPSGSSPDFSTFYNQPGYQFALNQGEQAINRGASANGSLYSSSTLGALGNYAAGTASTQYNNYVSQLMQMAGLGQNAANTTSGAAITTGNNISANAFSAGNANASGILGSAGAWNSALNGASNGAMNNNSAFGSILNNPNNNTNMVTYYDSSGNPYQGTVASGGF